MARILIAGLSGSGGKTFVSVGIAAALRSRGFAVTPYKKGPDYIDAAWLAGAAGRPCRNLDLYMMDEAAIANSFASTAAGDGISVIEGNRGLFDGMDAAGTFSSAELAKLLGAPVVLVCDVSKTTRTLAAMIQGCQRFDPNLAIAGVVLNRVAGPRHESILRDVVGRYCGIPVLGAIPRLPAAHVPERHLGLVTPVEHGGEAEAVQEAAVAVEEHVNLDEIVNIARSAPPLGIGVAEETPRAGGSPDRGGQPNNAAGVRIGVLRDEAFSFYYPENLEALERAGGRIVFLSPLHDAGLPELDALYIGGGFPESFANELAANVAFRRATARAAEAGLPIYAECAGAVYLGEKLIIGDNNYPMTGAMPVVYGFGKKPQGHGYTHVRVIAANPFFRLGESIRGHEFHYTHVLEIDERDLSLAFEIRRGHGVDGKRDGLCRKNMLATYCHIHALGVRNWAQSVVDAAVSRKRTPRTP
jgi:cobyrinic acid a,c-diamide synthase